MYERMLDKQTTPSFEDMAAYCGENAELFTLLNEWLCGEFSTEKSFSFPYGNHYGWCVAHRKKKKLLCNIFAENGSFSVMMRLSDRQYRSVYEELTKYTREYIDDRYPCGDGGWIHYRVACKEHFDDIKSCWRSNARNAADHTGKRRELSGGAYAELSKTAAGGAGTAGEG